jgi:hypothetical protein
VRDAFFASPQFPRLLNPDSVKDTIARGVENGMLGYVGKKGDGSYGRRGMRQIFRKHYHQRLPSRSSSERSRKGDPQVLSKAGNSTHETVTNAAMTPPARTTRYWLRNDTYVDLALPYEKVGVPFEPSSPTLVLTDDEKTKVILELSKCERAIRAGNLHVLELALEICNRCRLPAPVWLLPYAVEAINRLLHLGPRRLKYSMQREIHQIRWAAVHHLRISRRLTWEAAYHAAYKELYHTRARGSEETIRASYKWMNGHPFIKSMRREGLPGEIDAFAREQYHNRQAASERLISIEGRRTKPNEGLKSP